MTAFSMRLAAVFVAAIVAVVVAAAAITFEFVERPRDRSLQRAFAEEVAIVSYLVDGDPERARAAGVALGPPPHEEAAMRGPGRGIQASLRRMGLDISVRILRGADGERRLAFPVTDGDWAYLLYPSPPASPLSQLVAYLLLVSLGAVAVALFAVARIAGPLRVMETALSRVDADGRLAPIEERGPSEVRRTARALNALSARLSSALGSRMRLVAAAGHDLRTPMTRMRLRTEFLPEEERATWLRDLEELDRIADSAIRLVREEADPGPPETIQLGALLRSVCDDLSEIGLSVTCLARGDACVRGHTLGLTRALRNLIENAATHGGSARVKLIAGHRGQGGPRILIEDNGPGIPETLLDRVFEPFFRVDPSRRKSGPGAGLGLAIAKELLESNGARLSIHNRPEGGLTQAVKFEADTTV